MLWYLDRCKLSSAIFANCDSQVCVCVCVCVCVRV